MNLRDLRRRTSSFVTKYRKRFVPNCKQMGQELSRLWQEMKDASGFHRAAQCAAEDPNDPRRGWMMKAWPHCAENEAHHHNFERYKKLALQDKNRYQIEMMTYIPPTQEELQDRIVY